MGERVFPEEKNNVLKSVKILAREYARLEYTGKKDRVFTEKGCMFTDEERQSMVEWFRSHSIYEEVVEYAKIDPGEFIWLCETIFFYIFKTEFDRIYMEEHNIVIERKSEFKIL